MTNSKYKQTSVGLIPEEWEVKKLGEIAKIKHGRDQKKVENINGIYPILGTGGIIGRTNEFLYDKPSVLIGRKGTIDKPRFMETPFWTVDTLFYTELSMTINPKWLFNVFQTIDWYYYNQATGVPSLSASVISAIKIPFPPLQEQQKIAEILSTFDEAINVTKQIIDQVKIRNKGLVNKLILDNGELKVKLGNVFVESKIPTTDADVNKRITVRLTLKGIEKRGVRGSELEEATSYYLRKSGQFIYGKQNLHKGAFGIIPDELDGFESSSDIPAFDISKEYNSKYIFYYFTRRHFYEKLEDISTGTGSKRIQPRELYKIEIKVPSTLEKQNAIVKIIDTAAKELNQYQQKLETLQLQKKGLMQQLLTGKIRTV
jgi:type I restriction enzyme S subunit